jgi:hypothetical protein
VIETVTWSPSLSVKKPMGFDPMTRGAVIDNRRRCSRDSITGIDTDGVFSDMVGSFVLRL